MYKNIDNGTLLYKFSSQTFYIVLAVWNAFKKQTKISALVENINHKQYINIIS